MEWYRMVWEKYAQFEGRSRRKEYWMFQLINTLVSMALCGGSIGLFFAGRGQSTAIAMGILCGLYGVASFVPSLAVTVRRLHDIGRSGWWLLISLIPGGGLVVLVFSILDGTRGPNSYGPDPKNFMLYPGQTVGVG